MTINPAVRNVVIILAVAALIALLPGGGTVTQVVLTTIYVVFLAAMGWVGSVVYRERRSSLYLLGDRKRALLYGAVVALAVTLSATSRLWSSGAGSVAWLVIIGVSVYAIFAVVWAARKY